MSDEIPADAQVTIRGAQQVFMIFASLCGDVTKTAAAVGVRDIDIERMAQEGKWRDKLQAIITLKNSSDPATVERSVNRAMCFVQAHRMRLFLDRVVSRLEDMQPKEFEEYLLTDSFDIKTGQTKHAINGRPLADISSALEKCHSLLYQALSDTAQDRNRREEQEGGSNQASGDLHQKIALAMSQIADVKTPSQLLDEAQLASAAVLAERVKVTVTEPTKPYDKGD
jgi:hypothetical protein